MATYVILLINLQFDPSVRADADVADEITAIAEFRRFLIRFMSRLKYRSSFTPHIYLRVQEEPLWLWGLKQGSPNAEYRAVQHLLNSTCVTKFSILHSTKLKIRTLQIGNF